MDIPNTTPSWAISKIGNPYDQYSIYEVASGRTVATAVEGKAAALAMAASLVMLEALRYALDCIERGDTSDMQPVREAIQLATEG